MVARGTPLPPRIEPDAILEALFELRFDLVSPLPEVLFGRLSELPAWAGFSQRKLPAYDIPSQFRDADANLRIVPVLELTGAQPARAVRMGPHVLSYHRLPPYGGWNAFSQELDAAIDGLFAKSEGLVINRLGLRYINAFTAARHGIASVRDLDISLVVSEAALADRLSLTLSTTEAPNMECMVRVATREFAGGIVPEDATVIVDVDVFTPAGFETRSVEEVRAWLVGARVQKNQAFLDLLRQQSLNQLGRDP